jgi:hypothetical protein
MNDTAVLDNALELFGVPTAPDEFVLGTFDAQLTIFDQQCRALNLAYALFELKRIGPENTKPVIVIGAGIAGLTFAAACVWLGQKTIVLEKQPVPCHLQRGCEIRWIHPHIYHWPDVGSEQPYAGLPFLTWKEGNAADVTREILDQWEEISKAGRALHLLRAIYSATLKLQSRDTLSLNWSGIEDGKAVQSTETATCLVFAVGFGVEDGIGNYRGHSYWENDSFHQLKPNHPRHSTRTWLVSGRGDGGLIDLQRLTIENFRQGRVVEELFHEQEELVQKLRLLKEKKPGNLAADLKAIESDFKKVDERLRDRKRRDTEVVLNATPEQFEEALNQARASFLNRVIVHRLFEIHGFRYEGGELWSIDRQRNKARQRTFHVTLVNSKEKKATYHRFERVVVRHGTQREKWLTEAGYKNAESLRVHVASLGASSSPTWEPGWWSGKVDSQVAEALDGKSPGEKTTAWREFVGPITKAIASTFVQTVASFVEVGKTGKSPFRIALHRVVCFNGQGALQQISRYSGNRPDDSLEPKTELADVASMIVGTTGRVFSIKHLTIGLCARMARPVLFRSREESGEDLQEDMQKLHLDRARARQMNSDVRALLCVPFLGASVPGSAKSVNLVLYVDSCNPEFFSGDVLTWLHAACKDFREHVDMIVHGPERVFRLIPRELPLVGTENEQILIDELKTFEKDTESYGEFATRIDELKFENVGAFELMSSR